MKGLGLVDDGKNPREALEGSVLTNDKRGIRVIKIIYRNYDMNEKTVLITSLIEREDDGVFGDSVCCKNNDRTKPKLT